MVPAPPCSDPVDLRREIAELSCRRHRTASLDERINLAAAIAGRRFQWRIAEWRRTCGRLPDHLKQIDQKAAA